MLWTVFALVGSTLPAENKKSKRNVTEDWVNSCVWGGWRDTESARTGAQAQSRQFAVQVPHKKSKREAGRPIGSKHSNECRHYVPHQRRSGRIIHRFRDDWNARLLPDSPWADFVKTYSPLPHRRSTFAPASTLPHSGTVANTCSF